MCCRVQHLCLPALHTAVSTGALIEAPSFRASTGRSWPCAPCLPTTDLKNDRDVIFTAVQYGGRALDICALKYASDELKKDRDIVFMAVQYDGRTLEYASNTLQNDREVVLAAVKRDGEALAFASNDFKSDREVVLAAVKNRGLALEHASVVFKNDRDIVLAAMEENRDALEQLLQCILKCTPFRPLHRRKHELAIVLELNRRILKCVGGVLHRLEYNVTVSF